MRNVIDAFGSIVTRIEVFRTELDFRLTIITCDVFKIFLFINAVFF